MSRMTERGVVRLERTLPAPPLRVYRAWLEPEVLRRWLCPGGLAAPRAEVDERVGGHYRIWHTEAGSPVGGFECELLELDPHHRIVWRWGFVGPERNGGPRYDSLLTVTLYEQPVNTTLLTLVHERLEDLATDMPFVAQNVRPGWDDVLAQLAVALQAGGQAEEKP